MDTPTILIVEDDPVFRRVLTFTVERSGFKVETANHGGHGYDRLMQGGIDFLVTDLQMPICTGIELLERLEMLRDYKRPQTILYTAKGLELDGEALIKRFGLTAIMHKPFSPRKLSGAILDNIQPAQKEEVSPIAPVIALASSLVTPTGLHSHG